MFSLKIAFICCFQHTDRPAHTHTHMQSTESPSALSSGNNKKRILVSNDDGIDAPGVLSIVEEVPFFVPLNLDLLWKYIFNSLNLAAQLARHDKYDIVVVCPSEQQSAQSHAITLYKPLWAEPYSFHSDLAHIPAFMVCDFFFLNGKHAPKLATNVFAKVSGSPTDCVKVALNSNLLKGWKPDLLVSGTVDLLCGFQHWLGSKSLIVIYSLERY